MNLQDLFESQQQCPECGGPAFSDLILAEKKDACYNKVRSRYKVWPSAYASGALVQCRKKGAANWGNKSEGVAEGSEGQKFIVTYNNSLSNDLYTVMVSADDEYDAKDKVRYALGMGDRITDVKSARGNEPTDREYKVFVDPKTSQKRSGIYDRQQGLAEDVELAEEFDLIETIIDRLAEHNGVDAEVIWEDLESLTDDELYVFAVTTPLMEDWQKVNKRDKTDGMSRKAVKAYRRENPGSKLKTAVTTKPSKLKKGSKASKRRKSYCSRSRGQMKMHSISCAKTPDKAICKARRRWNCESIDFNLSEMYKTQTSPGRDGDIDWTKKQIHLGPEHIIKAKDVAQHALKALDKTMKKSHPHTPKKKGVAEGSEQKKPLRTHKSGCGYNYGHDCDCGGTLTHASDCHYNYGHDCDCGLDKLKQQKQNNKQQGVAEAGPFSHGKAARKGSVADLAAKKRREQERGKQPIEPKDQQVGVAKVTKGVAEAFGPLPKDNQQIRLGRHTVDIERVGLNKNYISFAWHDSKGKEHYEEVAVGDLGSYDDLVDRIKDEIRFQERQYTDQGVAEAAKWRQGYRASGHPPGYQHKSGEIGPLGGTYDTISSYDDEVKVPVNRYRDEPDRLADREKTKLSTSGKPLTAKNAARNLKTAIGQAKGRHGPVGVLPEQGVAEGDNEKIAGRYDPDEFDAMVQRLKKLAGAGPLKTVWDPVKRVYKNVPVAQQPKPQPR